MIKTNAAGAGAVDAAGRGPDVLAHLVWLLVDGRYVIERILKADKSGGYWLSLIAAHPASRSWWSHRGDVLHHQLGYPLGSDGTTISVETAPTRWPGSLPFPQCVV